MSKIGSGAHSAAGHSSPTLIDLLCRNALRRGAQSAYTFLIDGDAERVDLTYEEIDRRSRAIGA
jgi:hypothetical protein